MKGKATDASARRKPSKPAPSPKRQRVASGAPATRPWPATQPVMRRLEEIHPYPQNARTHPPEQIALLAQLMLRHGVDQPIVVDEHSVILKGHGRRLAAIEAKFAEFPVVVHRGLSEAAKKAIRLDDNQSALLSGWDYGLLRGEMLALANSGYEMKLLGFDQATLGWMMNGNVVENAAAEWGGMPEFIQQDKRAFRSIVVHFKDQQSVDAFAKAIKQKISAQTRFVWYPEIEIETYVDKRYTAR